MKRIIIAGTNSGCGKTTVTCAVLQALCNRNMKVSSFKCGPDYIDPMFHKKIIGTSSYNLDSFFCDDDTLKYLLYKNGNNMDISVIEGVMGFYDGVDERGSAYSVSQITDTSVIIVIDCKGMSSSIGAVMKGFLEYRKPNNIIGFIFNRLPEKLCEFVKNICSELGTQYFGFMPSNNFNIESRHLGLVTADEISDLKSKMKSLGQIAEKNILIDKLINCSEKDFPLFSGIKIKSYHLKRSPVIAVAMDKAFCFTYSDNISLLKDLGCEVEFFSPLNDECIPENADGLILSGGYPELYADKLAQNKLMLEDIKKKIISGIPTIAECGGFMYLHKLLRDSKGVEYGMVDIIDAVAFRTSKLQRFGYSKLTAMHDNILCNEGCKIPVHEFHYWDSTDNGDSFISTKSDGRQWKCVHAKDNLYAGFPHLYFYSNIKIAENFVNKCILFGGLNE